MKPHTQKFLQQRRFYMVLPLLVLPFITMIFWALGGGQGTPLQAQPVKSGLNMELPGAHFDKEDELWDKFSLYEQAKRDSLKYEEARRNDPYYVTATLKVKGDTVPPQNNRLNTSLGTKDKYAPLDQSEEMINRKIQQLTHQLNQPEQPVQSKTETTTDKQVSSTIDEDMTQDVDRLEKMMQLMSTSDVNDPEMQQIDGMLDKILDVQHPERVREKIKAQSLDHRQQVFPVATATKGDNISMVEGQMDRVAKNAGTESLDSLQSASIIQITHNSFYGLDEELQEEDGNTDAIEAVIHDTQTVVAGSIVKLRLLSDVYINGRLVEANQFIYGVCAIRGERLTINVSSVRDENSLLPVGLAVYDLDGLEGIYIPGAITRDVAKQAGSQSIQDIQLSSMDNSFGVQAATAGLEAAKGLFSKKAKLIKVTVKAGYQVLLKDTNQQNQR